MADPMVKKAIRFPLKDINCQYLHGSTTIVIEMNFADSYTASVVFDDIAERAKTQREILTLYGAGDDV